MLVGRLAMLAIQGVFLPNVQCFWAFWIHFNLTKIKWSLNELNQKYSVKKIVAHLYNNINRIYPQEIQSVYLQI